MLSSTCPSFTFGLLYIFAEPISRARTKVRYFSPDNDRVSFKAGQDVDVFIKRGDTWGIKVKYNVMI